MKALVLERDRELVFRDVPDPPRPGPDWALVRVAYAGICNSDLARGFGGGAYHYPLIMGHELSGTVEQAPEGSRFEAGARAAVHPLIPCGRCAACLRRDFTRCSHYDYLGSRRDGGFAELVWAPEANLFRIPTEVGLLHAALTEPCAVALHAVSKLPRRATATSAVFGAGPIGNLAAQWLRLQGSGEILVVDIDERKLELARSMGFTPIDARTGDPVAAIRERTDGEGADRVLEAVGLPITFRQCLQAAGRGGEVILMGNMRGELVLEEREVSSILRRELTIHGTWNSRALHAPRGQASATPRAASAVDLDEWTESLAQMASGEVLGVAAGKGLPSGLSIGPLVSHVIPLAEGAEAFRMILGRSQYTMKVVLQP